jgi:hypothetical protein
LAAAALLAEAGLRAGVYLENMRLDSGPGATRAAAASWIEANVREGESVGLVRFPEPAHTPPFRYDRYRLIIFERPEDLSPKRLPEYIVVDEDGRASIDNWAKNYYDVSASFVPFGAGWVRVESYSSFINAGMYVYRRRGAQPLS